MIPDYTPDRLPCEHKDELLMRVSFKLEVDEAEKDSLVELFGKIYKPDEYEIDESIPSTIGISKDEFMRRLEVYS